MKTRFLLHILGLLFSVFVFNGCAKKPIIKPPEPLSVSVVEPQPMEEPSLRGKEYKKVTGLGIIYFDYDDAALKNDARTVLSNNAEWLKKNPEVEIVIEGHCDERGTIDYNIALGDRRAKAVRGYLKKLGIEGNRVATISYGKEEPVDTGHDESAWSKNRRAESLGRIPPAEQKNK